ncbi:MAG: hypothetical protein KJ607_01475 [Bacteroidetes bacterium]|nr:hypothetical protein [Bacteroidota bacterium]
MTTIKIGTIFHSDKPVSVNSHYYFAVSHDQGLSFGQNYQVTSLPTDFNTVGDNNQSFGIGEYTQVLATEGYIIPVWCDGRQNNGNLNREMNRYSLRCFSGFFFNVAMECCGYILTTGGKDISYMDSFNRQFMLSDISVEMHQA